MVTATAAFGAAGCDAVNGPSGKMVLFGPLNDRLALGFQLSHKLLNSLHGLALRCLLSELLLNVGLIMVVKRLLVKLFMYSND